MVKATNGESGSWISHYFNILLNFLVCSTSPRDLVVYPRYKEYKFLGFNDSHSQGWFQARFDEDLSHILSMGLGLELGLCLFVVVFLTFLRGSQFHA